MFKRVSIVFMVLLLAAALGAKTKVISLPDLLKPQTLFFDKTQMYITEGASIYIYSLKDFKLVKKFGKPGLGPQEFIVRQQVGPLSLDVTTEDIMVNSFGKISWFTKDGKYKRELKLTNPLILNIHPFGKNFIGLQFTQEAKRMQRLNLYDENMKEVKNIIQKEHAFQVGKGTVIAKAQPFNPIFENKIFLAWENDLKIKVLDTQLNERYVIEHDIEKVEITEKYKQDIIQALKTSPETKDFFEYLKPIKFTSHFPTIFTFTITDNRIFVTTNKQDEEKNNECLVLDLKGKILKRVFIPLKTSGPFQPFPFSFRGNGLYQLLENEEEEEWELHITEIK